MMGNIVDVWQSRSDEGVFLARYRHADRTIQKMESVLRYKMAKAEAATEHGFVKVSV